LAAIHFRSLKLLAVGRKRTTSKSFNPLGILVPVLIVVIAGIFFKLYLFSRESKLLNLARYNFIVLEPLTFYSLNPKEKTAIKIVLPPNLYVDSAFGYGQYKLKSVYELGELDKRGGEVLLATVSEMLGVPVDGYIDSLNLKKTYNTNLNYLDLALLGIKYVEIGEGKIKNLDLSALDVLPDLVLADGSTVQTFDPLKFDFLTQGSFHEETLILENQDLEVLNVGEVAGLGNKAARILGNIGLKVVNVANAQIPIGDCEVKADVNSLTARRIAQIFGCKVLQKEPGRANVSLILRVLHPGE